jgi:2-phospho-L-lactate guanylyltransferase
MMDPAHVSGIWAILPVKRLDRAKSRLASMLEPSEREELAWAMFRDVLDTLNSVQGLGGTIVVTNDAKAADFARTCGAVTLPDPRDAGISAAVQCGLAWLSARNASGAIVVPGDIPFATPREIAAVIDRLRIGTAVLVPAARDGGTNILAMSPPGAFPVAYGENSFVRHLAAARDGGIEAHVLLLDGAGHDIDVSSDLFIDACEGRAMRTRAHLKRLARPHPASPTVSCKEIFQP